MKVYLITPEYCDYDEYDGLVVTAENKEEALALIEENNKYNMEFFKKRQGHISIQEIDLTKKQIILTSFNAG